MQTYRNIHSDTLEIASPTHDFWSPPVAPGDTIEVPPALGKALSPSLWEIVKTKADKADKADASADKAGE